MAKKIDVHELEGQEFVNKADDKFKVLYYQFKQGTNHMYDVQFIETGAIQLASRNQILKGTVQDLEKRKKLKRIKTELELKERNRLVSKHKATYNLADLHSKMVLSIDASTTSTGIAYAEKGVIKRSKVIKCDSSDFRERIFHMAREVGSILGRKNFDIVIIESTFLGLNSSVLSKLCELRGAIAYQVYNQNAELIEIPPVKWKHHFNMPTGRAEQKKFSILEAQKIMGYTINTDDEGDAVCMLQACLDMSKGGK